MTRFLPALSLLFIASGWLSSPAYAQRFLFRESPEIYKEWVASSPADGFIAAGINDVETHAATLGTDGIVRVHEFKKWRTLASIATRHSGPVICVDISPDGRFVATGSSDDTAHIYSVATGERIFSFSTGATVRAVAFSPDGRILATSGDGRSIRLWNARIG